MCPAVTNEASCSEVVLAVRGSNTECTDMGCLGTVYRYGSKCTGISEPTQGAELSLSVSLSLSLIKMAAREKDEFIVVRNERGKANIWRHFGFKKRKTDNTPVPSPTLKEPRQMRHMCSTGVWAWELTQEFHRSHFFSSERSHRVFSFVLRPHEWDPRDKQAMVG